MDEIITYEDTHPGAYFRINGVDILHYIKKDGLKWSWNNIDSAKTGRSTMDGKMHIARVAQKVRFDIECIALYRAEQLTIMNLINPVWVQVETNLHPLYEYNIAQYYSNNKQGTVGSIDQHTGASIWPGITFPLIEQ